MSKYATFEAGTLVDAVDRAAKVAPTKGAAYDKSAGIVMEVEPTPGSKPIITLKATDLEVYYLEWVAALETGDEAVTWRLPSGLFAGIMQGLPLHEGATVKISQPDGSGRAHISSGKMKAEVQVTDDRYFPQWEPFDSDDMSVVPDLARRIKQVAWACDKSMPPWSGVNIDGENLTATDKYRFARAPCEVKIEEGITVPLGPVRSIIQPGAEIWMKASSKFLYLMPDEHTQISSVIYDAKFPSKDKIDQACPNEFDYDAVLNREDLLTKLQSMMVLVRTERYPTLNMKFKPGSLTMFMEVQDSGNMEQTVLDPNMDADFEFNITPNYLNDALSAAESENITISMGPDPFGPVRIADDSDYRAWLMPRKV